MSPAKRGTLLQMDSRKNLPEKKLKLLPVRDTVK
jgi:hypothetical protein